MDHAAALFRPVRPVRISPSAPLMLPLLLIGLPALLLVAGLIVPSHFAGDPRLVADGPGGSALFLTGVLGGLTLTAVTPILAVALLATALEDWRRRHGLDPHVIVGLTTTLAAAALLASPVGVPLVLLALD